MSTDLDHGGISSSSCSRRGRCWRFRASARAYDALETESARDDHRSRIALSFLPGSRIRIGPASYSSRRRIDPAAYAVLCVGAPSRLPCRPVKVPRRGIRGAGVRSRSARARGSASCQPAAGWWRVIRGALESRPRCSSRIHRDRRAHSHRQLSPAGFQHRARHSAVSASTAHATTVADVEKLEATRRNRRPPRAGSGSKAEPFAVRPWLQPGECPRRFAGGPAGATLAAVPTRCADDFACRGKRPAVFEATLDFHHGARLCPSTEAR